ncbi:MAG TPA: LAGLIDADG family homing endonuclease, partial [Chloroflexia bacterium]|nr:LAGLIDADG family homing endonuclease [Chloroflexia bacterium]
MTGRRRTDAEEVADLPEDQPEYDYGGLGTMIAREMAVEARRARARREFFRIEHVTPSRKGEPESKVLGMYRVTGESGREYDVLVRDPNPEHHVNRCVCLDYESNNLGTCKHIEAVLGYIRRKHGSQLRAAKPRLLEINRLTVYVTLRYVGDGTWTAAPVYDHALDPGVLRLINHYLLPYLAVLEDDPDAFLKRMQRFVEEVEDFGGKVIVEPEVYDYAGQVKTRNARDARRRELMDRVEAGEARLDLLKLPLYPYQAVGTLFLAFTEKALLADDMGLGKAQPLDAKILTPTGWKYMGDIQVGDSIINSQGGVCTVVGVYPQGIKDIYRVEFTDGSSTQCCDEHLWQVNTPVRRRRGSPPRVKPLRELGTSLHDSVGNRQHFIPMVVPVQFEEVELPLDPYLVGVLIGDGGLAHHTTVLSSADPGILSEVERLLPAGATLSKKMGYDWTLSQGRTSRANPVTVALRSLGLMGHRSDEKFIPDLYKFASSMTRESLLQGLLDTDGHVRPTDNNIEFTSTSLRLALDIIELVQSLGGT